MPILSEAGREREVTELELELGSGGDEGRRGDDDVEQVQHRRLIPSGLAAELPQVAESLRAGAGRLRCTNPKCAYTLHHYITNY